MKRTWKDLMINGGSPLAPSFMPLCVGRPNMPTKRSLTYENAIASAWTTGRLTNDGPLVRELERRMEEWAGAEWAIAICNATTGLQIAMKALDVKGTVIAPSFTFPATIEAIRWIGNGPCLLDCDAGGWMDTRNVPVYEVQGVAAFMPVAAYGLLGETTERALETDAEWNGIAGECHAYTILDAAGSFGNTVDGRSVVSYGDCAVLSLHATKVVFGGEGGIIFTADEHMAKECRRLRNFGFDAQAKRTGYGINGKMSELHAALALASLEYYPFVRDQNEETYWQYEEYLKEIGLPIMRYPDGDSNNYHYVVTRIPDGKRDAVKAALEAENILARDYYNPGCHDRADADEYPQTVRLSQEVLVLPTGMQMTSDLVDDICQVIGLVMKGERA